MQHETNNTTQTTRQAWHTSPKLLVGLLIASFITWFAIAMMTAGEFSIKPTVLILKSEACNFLQQNGLHTKSTEDESGCTVTVPFRSSLFGNGGVIFQGENEIRIADSQAIVVGAIENLPWTPSQVRSVILVSVSSILLFAVLAWILIVILSIEKE